MIEKSKQIDNATSFIKESTCQINTQKELLISYNKLTAYYQIICR